MRTPDNPLADVTAGQLVVGSVVGAWYPPMQGPVQTYADALAVVSDHIIRRHVTVDHALSCLALAELQARYTEKP